MNRKNNSVSEEPKSIFGKILFGFVQIIGGTIRTKIGFALLLIIIGLICLFAPVEGKPDKPIILLYTGYSLMIIGILIIIRKIIKIKKIDKSI